MTDQGGLCRLDTVDSVAVITLASPSNRNALGTTLTTQLRDHLAGAATDPSIRVVVVQAEGSVFSSGWDLGLSREDGLHVDTLLVELLDSVVTMPKAVVAKVGGHAIGGALALVAACDLSVVSRQASFGFGEVRLGLAPTTAAVHCVPKMRASDARGALLTGERFDADRAVAMGLVNVAVDHDQLDDAVDQLVATLLLGAPRALGACKVLARSITAPDDAASALAAHYNDLLVGSDEAIEGVAAFTERRRPSWAPADDGPVRRA
ncbi:MAG: enoyl-CoA hydratase/isomerase family protein [Ilumatobacteraceae bacterium]